MTKSLTHLLRAAGVTALALLVFGAAASGSAAQDRYGEIAARHLRPHPYHEALVLPGSGDAQAVVSFRIPNPLLVFVQEGDGFLSDVEVVVSVFRDDERLLERIWRGEQRASDFDATQDGGKDLEGRVVFRLPPGTYSYRIELNDRSAGPPAQLEVPDFSSGATGMPAFAERIDGGEGRYALRLINLGGDAPYGEKAVVIVPVGAAVLDAAADVGYRLYRAADNRRASTRRESASDYELRDADVLVESGAAAPGSAIPLGQVDAACLCWEASDEASGGIIVLEPALEKLEHGLYVLEVGRRGEEPTHRQRRVFRTHWRDMPLSLYDHVVAVRNLTFIEHRDTLRAMLRGSREEQIERFRAYWRRRDPSPGTVFNELMEEYYRRVDHAAFEFRTGTTPFPDGLRTDAARVFVVHGPPDDVSNTFPSSGGVREVWTYEDGRRFVFWAPSSLEAMELQEETRSGSRGGSDE